MPPLWYAGAFDYGRTKSMQFVDNFWDIANLFASQASYDASPSAGKTMASTAVLQTLGWANAVATTNPPGTVVRSDGTVGYGAHNLLTDARVSNWSIQGAGATNNGIAAGITGPNGETAYSVTFGAAANCAITSTTQALPSADRIAWCYVKLSSGTGNVRANWYDGSTDYLSAVAVDSTNWTVVSLAKVATAFAKMGVYNDAAGGAKTLYICAATLNLGAVRTDHAPTTSAAVYAPRITFDRGAGSNAVIASELVGHGTYWGKTNTLDAYSAADSEGFVTLTPSTENLLHQFYGIVNASVSSVYTHSVEVKANGYTKFGLKEKGVTGNWAVFDLATGTVIASSGMTAWVEPAGAGAWRVCGSVATAGTQGFAMHVCPPSYTSADPNGGSNTFAGNGTSGIKVRKPQMNTGLTRTQYLGTTTAPLTTAGTPRSQNLATGSGTQSVTVVPGCVYTVIHQAGGTYTLSGAGSGTTTAAVATTVVATTSTLTLTASSSPTLLQVYEGTATLAYVAGPYSEYPQAGLLREVARTNLALWCRDLTNAAWAASSVTVAKTATGIDGVANSASTLTASGANGTVLQAITSGSAERITSAFVRRKTGTGVINMTQDNGTTWTAISVQPYWSQIPIPKATAANPTIGFRIVTSGDAIEVDYVQHEVGGFVTSPILTTTAAVTRDADLERPPTTYINDTAQTTVVEFNSAVPDTTVHCLVTRTGSGFVAYLNNSYNALIYDGTNTAQVNPFTANISQRLATRYSSAGIGVSLNGAAPATSSFDGTMGTSAGTVAVGDNASGGNGFTGLITRISIATRAANDADLQAASAGLK